MRTRNIRDLAARLEGLRRRFDRWRRTRKGRSRIPEALWTAAVKAAGQYGLCRTARTLRLDYYALKKRVEAAGCLSGGQTTHHRTDRQPAHHLTDRLGPAEGQAVAGQALAGFVELAPAAPAGWPECILELEAPGGAKMRVHLKGGQVPDMTALSRSFWNSACALHADGSHTDRSHADGVEA